MRCVGSRGPRDLTGPRSPPPFFESPLPCRVDLTYTFCSPSAVLFLSGRPVYVGKHGRMPPHMGQTMADTHGAHGPLFARSCFDEVETRPHNTTAIFFRFLFASSFSALCFRPFPFLSLACPRFLLSHSTRRYYTSLFCFLAAENDYKRKDEEEVPS